MLNDNQVAQIVGEIQDSAEVDRRAQAKRRVDIYKDGGRAFLVEKILREFGPDALSEMRLAPINLLKKIVDKRASIYRRSPIRKAELPSDQALVDYYVEEMDFNILMQKLNRYLVMSSNAALYIRPKNGCITGTVVPSYQYSLVPKENEMCEVTAVVFSPFVDEGRVAPQSAPFAATGVESFSQERGFKSAGDLVASTEKETASSAQKFIFWSKEQHFTTNESGSKFYNPELGEEQFLNPIGELPVILVARDRDNEVWATQGEDMIDLTMALQLGWTDVMTIAKHQGFSILTITSEEEPKKLTIGVNRAVWLKTTPAGPQPSIGYVQGNSPLEQYKGLLEALLGLLLTTNSMEPGSLGGTGQTKQFTSGFHALISMADSLEAIESDKPILFKAEQEAWEVIKGWHNWMYENDMLEQEARALGPFSDSFRITVQFADVRPLESEDERIARVKTLMDMGLLTRQDALKKLHPDLNDEMIQAKMLELDSEKSANIAKMQQAMSAGEITPLAEEESAQDTQAEDVEEPVDGEES